MLLSHLGRLRLPVSPPRGGDFIFLPLRRRGAALWLCCIPFLFFAAEAPAQSRRDASAPTPILVAQFDDQPADAAQSEEPAPAPKPTPRPPAKPKRESKPKSESKSKSESKPAGQAKKKSSKETPPPAAPPEPAAPAEPEGPPPPTPALAAPSEPQPVIHAGRAGVKACLDGIVRAANETIDTQHTAMSEWSQGAADSHVFESIVSLAYPNKVAPRAAVVLLGAPTRSQGCDTSFVQVFPTSRDCVAIQSDLLKDGKVIANLSGVPVTQSSTGRRQLLLPTPGNGCVIVVIGLNFGK